jgi:uncharacterized protein (DUF1330 family)
MLRTADNRSGSIVEDASASRVGVVLRPLSARVHTTARGGRESMGSIDPTPAKFKALFTAVPPGKPVVMLNLLRFRERAEYGAESGHPPRSGREAYGEYSREAVQHVKAVGGRVIWQGHALHSVIAPEGETWDEVFLVEYPSIEAFIGMVRSPQYQAFTHHRTAALADSRLIATSAAEG